MKHYGLSRYEEIMKFYKEEVEYLASEETYLILDETGLDLDKTFNFNLFKDSKVLEILCDSLNKVEVILECKNQDLEYVKLAFESISYYMKHKLDIEKASDLLASVDFIELKKGFRVEFRKKAKKSRSKQQFDFFEIEACYLTIEGLDNYELNQPIEAVEEDHINSLVKNLNITKEKAAEIIQTNYENIDNEEIPVFFTKYSRQITDKDGKLDKLRLEASNVSEDFKFLLNNFDLGGSTILSCGKTFYEDEFYIVIELRNRCYYGSYEREDFYFDENGFLRLKDDVLLIKFEDLISFKGDYLYFEPYFEYLNVILYNDNSYEFRIGDGEANFMKIHSNNISVKVLKSGTRADVFKKRFSEGNYYKKY